MAPSAKDDVSGRLATLEAQMEGVLEATRAGAEVIRQHDLQDQARHKEIVECITELRLASATHSAGMKPWMVILGVLGMALVTFIGSVAASWATSYLGK